MAEGQPDLLAGRRRRVTLRKQPMVPMRTDLLELFDVGELKKYMTYEELAVLDAAAARATGAAKETH